MTIDPAHLSRLILPFQRKSELGQSLARFRPYPKPFRKTLQFAWHESKAYSSPEILPEHLLLGLLRATESLGHHVSPTAIRPAIAAIDVHVGHGRTIPAPVNPIVSALSQQVIARALETAAFRRERLSTLHLLLALCEVRSGVIPECLDSLNLDRLWIERQLRPA